MQIEDSIIQELPQIPYVIDQVSEALAWAKESLNEGEYNRVLKITQDVISYTKGISDPNFFKTHYVIASILSNIEVSKTDERFAKFDSASKAVEKALDDLIVKPEDIEKNGCFKTVLLHLIPLAKKNMDLFAISLIAIERTLAEIVEGIKNTEVKSPITANDYITVLGYALLIANIRMANIKMPNAVYEIYNKISIMLNNDLVY